MSLERNNHEYHIFIPIKCWLYLSAFTILPFLIAFANDYYSNYVNPYLSLFFMVICYLAPYYIICKFPIPYVFRLWLCGFHMLVILPIITSLFLYMTSF